MASSEQSLLNVPIWRGSMIWRHLMLALLTTESVPGHAIDRQYWCPHQACPARH